MRLEDRVAIITGAASGIGAASARLFAEEGAAVTVVDINAEGARRVAGEIAASGGRAHSVAADVAGEADWQRVLSETLAQFGRVDILFNNAGIGLTGTILDTPPEEWDHIHGVNLRGVYLGCRTVLPHMIERGSGVIVNTASELGTVGSWGIAAYSASKFGVVGLTRCIALDFARHGIRANALCPGPIDTPLLRASQSAARNRPVETNSTVMGRPGRPEEAAKGALFLACDDSSFMTGATLVVDGGLTAH